MKKEVDENNVVSYKQDNGGPTAEVSMKFYQILEIFFSWEEIIIGKSGTEAVQILLHRNWLVLFSAIIDEGASEAYELRKIF